MIILILTMGSNPPDQRSSPRVSDSEADEHQSMASADPAGGEGAFESDRDATGDRIAHVIHRHPEPFCRHLQFLLQMIQQKLVRLMENKQVDIFHFKLRLREDLANGIWHDPKREVEYFGAIHVEIVYCPAIAAFIRNQDRALNVRLAEAACGHN